MEKDEIEEQIIQTLNKNYSDDKFVVQKIWNATSPGSAYKSYTSKVSSEKFTRRDFYLNLDEKDGSLTINSNTYPKLLLEESYLDRMRAKFSDNNSLFFDVSLGYLNEDTPDLKSKSDADKYISNNDQIEWVDLIGVYTDDYDNTQKLVEEITPIIESIHDIYKGGHEIIVHFYPKSLQSENLEFHSDADELDKAPIREKQFAFWTINWRKHQLEDTNGSLDSFIENRKVVKQWRNSSN